MLSPGVNSKGFSASDTGKWPNGADCFPVKKRNAMATFNELVAATDSSFFVFVGTGLQSLYASLSDPMAIKLFLEVTYE